MKRTLTLFTISILLLGCFGNDKLCYERRELKITPQIGVGEFKIGMTENSLKSKICNNHKVTTSKPLFSDKEITLYFIENMSFVLENSRVIEINVWGNFIGTYEEIDTDYDIELLEYYGEVIKHEGQYRILDIPGIAFGFEDGDEGKYIRVF